MSRLRLAFRPHPWAALLLVAAGAAPAADPAGEQIYRARCASCHGDMGEGSKKFKRPLAGDKTVPQLAQLIAKTMPEDDPGTCVGPEAEKVAAYIHDAFYSKEAREKNRPARVDLARLTVRQYRNAVADLLATFRPAPKGGGQPGLHGEYFAARGFRTDKRVIDRVDSEVRFDFGTRAPGPEKFEHYEYSIRWEGSVTAPETGEYEFVVRTEHAVRLWVNDPRRPLIDAWVKSGTETEFKGTLFLLAGRAYPLRLEYSKATQGVNNPEMAKKAPPTRSSITLLWQLPHRTPEVISARYLSTAKAAEAYVPATAFPPDDRSLGWERGTTVSKAWDQAATDAALDAAGYIAARLNELAGVAPADPGLDLAAGNPAAINLDRKAGPDVPASEREKKLRDFARRLVERAFRRPLTEGEKQLYVDHQFAAASNPDLALKRVVLLTLKSPRFLYREAIGPNDGYAVASRLSFGLWDSLPDDELLKAAAAGQLATREQAARQADRMLSDPRAKAKLRDFLHTWLKVDQAPDVAKDPKRFPGFSPDIVTDLRTSLDLSLDDVVWSDRSDFRRLLTDDGVYLNGRLARFYGTYGSQQEGLVRTALSMLHAPGVVLPPADLPFQKVRLDPGQRAGVLTHPYPLAAFAYTGSTSPIHRGVFVARGVLGIGLRPPPEAFTPLAEDLHPTLTTRERVMLQTKPAGCQSCHGVINPLGFTLERFDAVGRLRDRDNGKPVDATGQYQTRDGKVVQFAGARELAAFLANSEEVHVSFAEQLFHHLVQQPVRAYGPGTLADLRQAFARLEFSIRRLAVEVMATAALPPEPKR